MDSMTRPFVLILESTTHFPVAIAHTQFYPMKHHRPHAQKRLSLLVFVTAATAAPLVHTKPILGVADPVVSFNATFQSRFSRTLCKKATHHWADHPVTKIFDVLDALNCDGDKPAAGRSPVAVGMRAEDLYLPAPSATNTAAGKSANGTSRSGSGRLQRRSDDGAPHGDRFGWMHGMVDCEQGGGRQSYVYGWSQSQRDVKKKPAFRAKVSLCSDIGGAVCNYAPEGYQWKGHYTAYNDDANHLFNVYIDKGTTPKGTHPVGHIVKAMGTSGSLDTLGAAVWGGGEKKVYSYDGTKSCKLMYWTTGSPAFRWTFQKKEMQYQLQTSMGKALWSEQLVWMVEQSDNPRSSTGSYDKSNFLVSQQHNARQSICYNGNRFSPLLHWEFSKGLSPDEWGNFYEATARQLGNYIQNIWNPAAAPCSAHALPQKSVAAMYLGPFESKSSFIQVQPSVSIGFMALSVMDIQHGDCAAMTDLFVAFSVLSGVFGAVASIEAATIKESAGILSGVFGSIGSAGGSTLFTSLC